MDLQAALALVKPFNDFPKKGILFQDIHPIMYNAAARKAIQDHLAERYRDYKLDAIVGLDSRGYYFGVPLADALGLSFVPARKGGKLPGAVKSVSYGLEYGESVIEMQEGALNAGARVLVVDDLMATGGTAAAACQLVQQIGGHVVEVHVLIELAELNGRAKLPAGVPLHSLCTL